MKKFGFQDIIRPAGNYISTFIMCYLSSAISPGNPIKPLPPKLDQHREEILEWIDEL